MSPIKNTYLDDIQRMLKQQEAKIIQQQRQQGLGNPIVSAEFNGSRLVAVRNKLHYSKNWKTFNDFLSDYLKIVFEKEWWLRSFNRPREEPHPIMHWAHLIQEQHSAIPIEPNKISSIPATGAMSAYLSLSYDLYSIAHNVEMQSKLVERLKNTEQFWGARYEVFTAATLIRAGFDVEFENEDDRTTTHYEFTATNRKSGRKFSVECKHRASTRSRIGRQLNKALQKQAKHERLIFIDVNESDISEHSDTKPMLLLKALNALRLFENKPIAGNYLPNSYIVISNTPHHHHLNSTNFRVGVLLEGFQIPDFKHDAMFQSLRDAIESKERHIELHDLALSIQDHSQIR